MRITILAYLVGCLSGFIATKMYYNYQIQDLETKKEILEFLKEDNNELES